jgi:hypothetical protein
MPASNVTHPAHEDRYRTFMLGMARHVITAQECGYGPLADVIASILTLTPAEASRTAFPVLTRLSQLETATPAERRYIAQVIEDLSFYKRTAPL